MYKLIRIVYIKSDKKIFFLTQFLLFLYNIKNIVIYLHEKNMKTKGLLAISSLLLLASCSNQQTNTSWLANSSDANFTNTSDLASDTTNNMSLNQNIQRTSYKTSNWSDSRSKAS